MHIIGQIEKEDTLTLFIEVDKYYLYEVKFIWHKSKQWAIKSLEMVCVLDHHVPLVEEKLNIDDRNKVDSGIR